MPVHDIEALRDELRRVYAERESYQFERDTYREAFAVFYEAINPIGTCFDSMCGGGNHTRRCGTINAGIGKIRAAHALGNAR